MSTQKICKTELNDSNDESNEEAVGENKNLSNFKKYFFQIY